MSRDTNPKSTIFEVLCVAVPKVLGGVSQMLLSLILVRVMGPEQFGMVSVCFATVLLLDSVFGSAIDMAIFRLAPLHSESNPVRARQIEKAGLVIKPIGSLVLFFPLLVLLKPISTMLFQDSSQGSLLLLTFAALVGLLTVRSMQVHFQIERRFVAYGISDLCHTLARFGSIGILLFVYRDVSPNQIMAIYFFAATTVTTLGLLLWSRPVLSVPFSMGAASDLLTTLRAYLPTVVIGSIASRMDVFCVTSWGGVSEAGIYGAAQMFAIVPQLLGSYAAAVFSPRILPMWREGKLRREYPRYQALFLILSILIFISAWLLTGPLGSVLLPEAYSRSRTVVLILLPAGLAAMINFPLTVPLLLYTHPRLVMYADLIAIPLAAAGYYFAVPGNGAAVAAGITSAWAFVRLCFYQGLAYRLLRRDPSGNLWMESESSKKSLEMAGSTA